MLAPHSVCSALLFRATLLYLSLESKLHVQFSSVQQGDDPEQLSVQFSEGDGPEQLSLHVQ